MFIEFVLCFVCGTLVKDYACYPQVIIGVGIAKHCRENTTENQAVIKNGHSCLSHFIFFIPVQDYTGHTANPSQYPDPNYISASPLTYRYFYFFYRQNSKTWLHRAFFRKYDGGAWNNQSHDHQVSSSHGFKWSVGVTEHPGPRRNFVDRWSMWFCSVCLM